MNLQSLSTPELLQNTGQLAARERELSLQVIAHLREIQRRRAFVELGYSSLWDYVTQGLKYSSGAAKRRIDALHALGEHPELEESVSSGTLSLSTVSQVQSFARRHIPKLERLQLFQSMAGKSTREVEHSLCTLVPEAPAPERERAVSETRVELQFTIPIELREKLKRLQGLCAHRLKDPTSYAELLEILADLGQRELDPGREPKRKRPAPKSESPGSKSESPGSKAESSTFRPESRVSKPTSSAPNESARQTSRHIPAPIRREVWRRSEGRCTYRDPQTGRPCASKFALQVDHLKPFARGGSSTDLKNLTLLCRQHNLHRAVKSFGPIPFRSTTDLRRLEPVEDWEQPVATSRRAGRGARHDDRQGEGCR